MTTQRDIRRLAMQVLYQMDVSRGTDVRVIGHHLDDQHDSPQVRGPGLALAEAAWLDHERADALVTDLAPQWPTHRQPPVDRAILRLAYYEMASGRTPVNVSINEAVELAKIYGAKESSAFINGVLDKIARRIRDPEATPISED